jgi:putative sigma-54 modulation protein
MRVHVRSRQVKVDKTAFAHIERRLQFNLGRFSSRILRVTVRFVDLNGPRGGVDKNCRIEIRLLPTGSIFVSDTDADFYAAFDRAADRVARSVARTIKRSQDFEHNAALPGSLQPVLTTSDTDEEPATWG